MPIKANAQPTIRRKRPRRRTAARLPQRRYRGRGDYSTEINAISSPAERIEAKIDHLEKALVKNPLSTKNAAENIGRTLGNFLGQGDIGAYAGSALSKYFGHGDYTVKTNSLMSDPNSATKFQSANRGTRFIEREYIGEVLAGPLVSGSTSFTNQSYIINPTDAATFPWLSQIATLYDQWEPNGIIFEYRSTSSEYNGSSQALGAVVMATDYDPYDTLYANKQQMENSDYASSTKPAISMVHGIECDPNERPVPILYTSTSNGAPLNTTQLGRFQIATQGCSAAAVTLGELWISYDITFYKKQQLDLAAVAKPAMSAYGATDIGYGFFSAPNYTFNNAGMSITQNIGVGSIINLNNTYTGAQYTFTVTLVGAYNTNDDLNTDITYSGMTVVRRFATQQSGASATMTVTLLTTSTYATVLTSLKAAGACSWYVSMQQCPLAPFIV